MTMIEVGKQPFNSAVVGKQDTPTTEANQTSKPRRVARPRNLPRETKSNTTQTSKPAARHPAPTVWNKPFVFTSPTRPINTTRIYSSPKSKKGFSNSGAPKRTPTNTPKLLPFNDAGIFSKKTVMAPTTQSRAVTESTVEPVSVPMTESQPGVESVSAQKTESAPALKVETEGELKLGEALAPKLEQILKAELAPETKLALDSTIAPKAEIVAAPTIDPVTTPDAKEEPVLGIEAKPAPTAVPISAAAQAPITELTPVAVGDPAPESEPETISKSGTHDGIKVPTLEQSSAHTAPSFPNGTCGRDSIQSNSQSSKLVVGADVGAALEALEAKHAQLCTRKKDIILEMLADQEKAEEEYNAALKQALEKKQEILVKNTERMKAIDNEISANHKEIDAATAKADHILRSAVHPRIVMLLEARAASVANNIASKQTSK